MVSEQLPLNVFLKTHYRINNYVAGPNKHSLHWLTKFAETKSKDSCVVIWGKAVGKTHLMSALCNYHTDLGAASFYIPLSSFQDLDPSVLQNVEQTGFVVVDDIQVISGNQQWEMALFNLYNRVLETNCQLLMSSDCAPHLLDFQLKDLQSRINQCLNLRLHELTEAEKKTLLQQRAKEKGLIIQDEVYDYIFRHCPREIHWLIELLDKLDSLSLVKKRKVTIPFVKEVLSQDAIPEV